MPLEDEFGDIIRKARIGLELALPSIATSVGISSERLAALEAYQASPTPEEVQGLGSVLTLDPAKLRAIADASWHPDPVMRKHDSATVESLVVRQPDGWTSNCHILGFEGEEEALIVDPGAEAERILSLVEQRGWAPRYVALTHGHWDHIGGLPRIVEEWGVLVLIGAGDRAMLGDFTAPIHVVTDDETIPLGHRLIRALSTPGHTAGGTCYLVDHACFVGDSLFAGSVGKANVPGGYRQLLDSVKSKVLALDPHTTLFAGHGPATTVGEERAHNPFF